MYNTLAFFVLNIYTTYPFISFFFLMIRRPPRSTLDRSSAASDVYKRQGLLALEESRTLRIFFLEDKVVGGVREVVGIGLRPVSYTHLRAHETVLDLVCRLLLEKKKSTMNPDSSTITTHRENN
mgnify:CR=1 FL=1